MTPIRLVHHAPGAPGLRWLGLGPDLRPSRALIKLQRLFDRHAFWARGRSFSQLRRLLAGSDAGRNLHADLLRAVLHGELLAGRSGGRDGDGDRLHRWYW